MSAGSEPCVVARGGHRRLLMKGQDLQMDEGAATEQTRLGKKQRGEKRLHLQNATVREEKKSTGSISTTFPVGTRYDIRRGGYPEKHGRQSPHIQA